MAIYQLENYIQSSIKVTNSEIEIENDDEVKELCNNYVRLFKVHKIKNLKIKLNMKFYKYINEDFKFLDFQSISTKLKLPESIIIPEEKNIVDRAIFDDLKEWENPNLAKTTSELIINHHFNLYYNQNITYALINALLYQIFLLIRSPDYAQFKINRNLVEALFMTLKISEFYNNF